MAEILFLHFTATSLGGDILRSCFGSKSNTHILKKENGVFFLMIKNRLPISLSLSPDNRLIVLIRPYGNEGMADVLLPGEDSVP